MIFVVATIQVTEGERNEFLKHFRELVPSVQAEDGCIEYQPTIDLETGFAAQPPVRTNVVTVMEKWKDLDALKAHLVAPHMEAYRSKVKSIVVGTSIQVVELA